VVVQLPELKVRKLPNHWRIDFGHLMKSKIQNSEFSS
jgi:hypothetical protein